MTKLRFSKASADNNLVFFRLFRKHNWDVGKGQKKLVIFCGNVWLCLYWE